jgi:hypothetical protein
MTQQIFNDSSFTLKSRENAWVIPPDAAVLGCMELSPHEVKLAVMGLFMNLNEENLNNMDNKDCADALIINAIIVAHASTSSTYSDIIRHLGMPYKYRMAFEQLEKKIHDTPTSEDLKEMFGM